DGWFLVDKIPYDEMISSAFRINEGIVNSILDRLKEDSPKPEKVSLLGMTFKRGSDDIRDSVAFRFRKRLRLRFPHCEIVEVEPHVEGFHNLEDIRGSDWVILVTPHEQFSNLSEVVSLASNDACLYCDIWGYWKEQRYKSKNGLFFGKGVSK
ncbi:MAG: UDP binding domain-containing protein, partial [Candidatus Thorarchaeota archaeon]